MIESLNPYVKVYELKFERKMGRGEEAIIYGVPDSTVVVFHNNRVDEVHFGASLTVKGGANRAAPFAYKVLNALPPVSLDGEFESGDPTYKFPITAQLIVRVNDPINYITRVTKPFDIFQQIVGRVITSVTRKHQLQDYDSLAEKIEQALLNADTHLTYLKIERATVDVKLDEEHVRFLRNRRAIEIDKALSDARGKSRDEVLTDLANLLELVQKLRLRMDDLGIQDVLLDGLRSGIEKNIHQLLGGGASAEPARPRLASPAEIQIRKDDGAAPPALTTRDRLGGSPDDFEMANPSARARPADQFDDDDLFFDDDQEN